MPPVETLAALAGLFAAAFGAATILPFQSEFVLAGRIRIDGDLPVATNGGILSYSHAGVVQLLQKPLNAVLQMQGRLVPELTLHEPKVALATNGGSGALFCDVMALGKELV